MDAVALGDAMGRRRQIVGVVQEYVAGSAVEVQVLDEEATQGRNAACWKYCE